MPNRQDVDALIRDKYAGDRGADMMADLSRLARGEPLAYVIGWVPFLSLHLDLDSRPLIPRPETEWWTEKLITYLKKKYGDQSFTLLDLCAGSGAIGLSILREFPNARVSFGELIDDHAEQIKRNLEKNDLDASRADVRAGDLFAPFTESFDIIATNPPYIPEDRKLEDSLSYEPKEALYAGADGMDLIKRIITEVPEHINEGGELWMECDIDNIETARLLLPNSEMYSDPYGRPRLLVGHY